ncbi:hypothetical protein L484_026126 [Morus notabilis]|uniref:Diacylglycerol O-acyltransferase 3, cytosolic n=1 Tax=Morus notabilis TaxID=981085 RepID=W9RG98_9ROSA|nr:diacylglycerol O-acyltransferase 3, cytosolic isoform X2 [Morus notabilis]EXB75649.1 hypothetical protein L484_026126 [Morus notabilis]
MEVSQQLRCFSSKPSPPPFPAAERTSVKASFSAGIPTTRIRPSFTGMKTEFLDLGHLEYYHTPKPRPRLCVVTAKKKNDKEKVMASKKKKKTLKLLKALSQNLSVFSDVSQLQDHQESADVLLKHLEKLRAEEKELKVMKKQDKANLKAEQMAIMIDNDSSSSSSSSESSESSDSKCGEVIDMNRLRSQNAAQHYYDDSLSAAAQVAAVLAASLRSLPTANATEEERGSEDVTSLLLQKHEKESECRPTTSGCCSKRVDVCMGNKCKKSGSVALMEEFARQMGGEGAVVGCKCMGKCRSAPNVRVVNSTRVEGATDVCVRTAKNGNPLCLGVGLEDVSAIVASLVGEDTRDFGLAAAV